MFFKPKKKLASIGVITLRESGMRFCHEYEITCEGGEAVVVLYGIRFGSGGEKDSRVPEARARCSAEEMIALLDRCGFMEWDGFNGPHPRGVLDGIMFSLEAEVNGGDTVRASGSQNFPRHYRDFRDEISRMLRESTETV